MVFSLSVLLSGPYSILILFFLTIAASYVIIPAIGGILVSFGASSPSVKSLILLIAIIYLATLIGDISLYFIARRFSKPVLKFVNRFEWFKKNYKKSKPGLKKYGFWFVLVSRVLVTEVCLAVNYAAGFTKFDWKKFVIADIIGEFLYAAGYLIVGFIFKDTWNYFIGLIQNSIWIIILVIIALYLSYKAIKSTRKLLRDMKNKE